MLATNQTTNPPCRLRLPAKNNRLTTVFDLGETLDGLAPETVSLLRDAIDLSRHLKCNVRFFTDEPESKRFGVLDWLDRNEIKYDSIWFRADGDFRAPSARHDEWLDKIAKHGEAVIGFQNIVDGRLRDLRLPSRSA